MTPIERVARALCKSSGTDPDTMLCLGEPHRYPKGYAVLYPLPAWQHYIEDARVAIKALREPSGRMLEFEWKTGDDALYKEGDAWRAMIDAALSEGESR